MTTLSISAGRPASRRERVESVDALRGLLAVGVMGYHYTLWTSWQQSEWVAGFLRLLGLYGVELFFIISGFSLYYVYETSQLLRGPQAAKFAVKRFFRIAPLYYLAVGLVLALKLVAHWILRDPTVDLPSVRQVAENGSLFFGLWNPAASLVVGGWSIGVEWVFYLLFPVLVALFRRGPAAVWAGILAASAGAILVERLALSADRTLADQWGRYVDVVNHLPFFAGGMCLVMVRRRIGTIHTGAACLLVAALVGAATWSCMGVADEAFIVVGWRRYVLTGLSFGVAICVCCLPVQGGPLRRIGAFLGDVSYSVYLLHFFSMLIVQRLLPGWHASWLVGFAVAATLCGAALSHYTFEKYFMARGRRVADWLTQPRRDVDSRSDSNGGEPRRLQSAA